MMKQMIQHLEGMKKNSIPVKIRETVGKFVFPKTAGRVEVTGWNMSNKSTILAIVLKAHARLTGVLNVAVYSGDILFASNNLMTASIFLHDMKVGKAALLLMGKTSIP